MGASTSNLISELLAKGQACPTSSDAEVLATKGARQSWKNEAKSKPIDRPRVATSLPSATGRTTLGQEVFGRANIDLPGIKHSPAET